MFSNGTNFEPEQLAAIRSAYDQARSRLRDVFGLTGKKSDDALATSMLNLWATGLRDEGLVDEAVSAAAKVAGGGSASIAAAAP